MLARLLFPRNQLLFKRRPDEALGFSPNNSASRCTGSHWIVAAILEPLFCHLLQMLIDQLQEARLSWPDIKMPILQRIFFHITPGFLPKSLHTLNLSRNKISTIEGLRELTRLHVLDLSYNRISRIGQGLSNCTPVKELYLAGNKISDVEGLHRLLKLTVLDLSFNKITTTKALGQLVANYNSLQALNLLGNPIQSNIGDEQLRKAVCGLLPKLVYLNKDVVKPQRAREMLTDSVAKAVLGNSRYVSVLLRALVEGGCVSELWHPFRTADPPTNHGFQLGAITAAGTDGFPALIKLLPNPEQF
ncbi:hypothetical protein KIW84_071197 [Lathyrus oleraceus]|uniref:Uncharacterized protein n=1 Tax=Pisum sativum TaxID=3888 RepID=A0A9D4VID4_PEA|nr:hypothetical protein KIW84_071197 [Pisum sativum]